jgi:hypothetical protein
MRKLANAIKGVPQGEERPGDGGARLEPHPGSDINAFFPGLCLPSAYFWTMTWPYIHGCRVQM